MDILEQEQVVGTLILSLPELSSAQLIEISNRLIAAQEKFAKESIYDIVAWIDQAVTRWRDPSDPIRQEAEAVLPQVCGLSKEMVQVVLDDLFKNLTGSVLLQLLESELVEPNLLDRFCPKKKSNVMTRAYGAPLITHILPGNVLGVSVVSLVCGLLVKSANLLRVSREELLLTTLFAQTLQAVWPEMAQTVVVLTWDKAELELTKAAFEKANLVIAYGNNETISAISPLVPQGRLRVFHGHKLSFGVIARESICDALAQKVAIDISLYDQRGCLSPHLYYVESGGETSVLDFATQVAEALDAFAKKWPKGKVSPDEASKVQQLRGAVVSKGGKCFSSLKGVDWTVLYDPDPEFIASPLSRTIWIKPLQDFSTVMPLLEPIGDLIQAIGIDIPEDRALTLLESISKIGGCRICPIGEMQSPPLNWHHDGGFRLLPLLRFVDWEK